MTDAERERLIALEAVLINLRGKVAQCLKSEGLDGDNNRYFLETRLGWLAYHIDGMIEAQDIRHDSILAHRDQLEHALKAD